jgi:hypothetical protein
MRTIQNTIPKRALICPTCHDRIWSKYVKKGLATRDDAEDRQDRKCKKTEACPYLYMYWINTDEVDKCDLNSLIF